MEEIDKFKYGEEIKYVLRNFNLQLRDDLKPPNNKETYRFFHNIDHKDNHKPPYKISPARYIQPPDRSKVTCDGFALSCFPSVNNAEGFYKKKKKTFKNFQKVIGNSICSGALNNEDGLVSDEDKGNFYHFEFYEFKDCILNNKFPFVKMLP